MRRQRPPEPHNRDGIWYLVRKVPKEFRDVDDRGLVRISTEIRVVDDPRMVRARPAVIALDRELHAYWKGKREGRDDEARRRFEEARDRARAMDLPYQTATELAEGPLAEILKRVNLLLERGDVESELDVAALLGGEERPKLMLSELQGEFESIEAATLGQMNDKQRRKAANTRSRSVANFIAAIKGDKALVDLNRTDGIAFRVALQTRVATGTIEPDSANREMGAVSKMLKTVAVHHQLEVPRIFNDLRIADGTGRKKKRTRPPFSTDWIVTKILAPGALDGLNEEARHLVLLLIDHGPRQSEFADLDPSGLHLTHSVPHVSIEPIGKILKTLPSERDLPLVGAGPEIIRRHPSGFPRYRGKDALSAVVNKYFREHGLMETPKHTLNGLRHAFEDRLTAVEAPEKVVTFLMGHEWHREKYGDGPSLEQKKLWLDKIALTRPEHVTPPA